MGKCKVKVPHEVVETNMIQWLGKNVGTNDVDWTITYDLVEWAESKSGLITHVHFAREEDAVKFTLTWL